MNSDFFNLKYSFLLRKALVSLYKYKHMDKQKEGNILKNPLFYPFLSRSHSPSVWKSVLMGFGKIFHDSLWLTAGQTKHSEDMKGYN